MKPILISSIVILFLHLSSFYSILGRKNIKTHTNYHGAQREEQITLQKWREDYRDGKLSYEQTASVPPFVYAKAAHIYHDLLSELIRQKIANEVRKVSTYEYWQNRWEEQADTEGSSANSDGFFSEGYPPDIKAYIERNIDYVLKKQPSKKKTYIDIGSGDNTSIAEEIYEKYQKDRGIVSKVNTLDPVIPSHLPEQITHIQRLAEDTGLPDNSYDLVTILFTFSYTKREETLRELYRILRADGYAILILHHPNSATLRHHYLMFYANCAYLLGLENIKLAVHAFSPNQVETLNELDDKEFRLISQFNKDFDLKNPNFKNTYPHLIRMIEEHDAYIVKIIQIINDAIRTSAIDAKKIEEWLRAIDIVSLKWIRAKAFFLKMTQDLYSNMFKNEKAIVEFMRKNGFNFEPLEIHTFFDGDGLPAAYGMIIKKDPSFNDEDI
jgi:SAM-dependent methyltransferase